MCWMCDNPRATQAEADARMWRLIEKYGWAVQGIEAGKNTPAWGYTVGLSGRGLPELVVTGLKPARLMTLLNDLAAHATHAEGPKPGSQVQLRNGPLLEFVELSEPSAHLFTAVRMFGPQIRAIQAVHADDRGQWPWSRGFRGGRGGQPVLGPRSVGAGRQQ